MSSPSPQDGAPNPIAALEQGIETALRAGELEDAATRCEKLLAEDPEHFDASYLLAILHARQGRFEEALRYNDRALTLKPGFAPGYLQRGLLMNRLDLPQQALGAFEEARRLQPEDAAAHRELGKTLRKLGRLDDALDCLDRLVQLAPAGAENHFLRATVLLEMKRYEEALESCDLSLRFGRRDAPLLNNRANALRRLARYEEALVDCDEALTLAPYMAEAHYNRATTLHALKRYDEALQSCVRALEIEPDSVDFLATRGAIENDLERHEQAITTFREVLDRDPRHLRAWNGCAAALIAAEHYDLALPCLDRALDIAPCDATAHQRRGHALMHLDLHEEAISAYEAALDHGAEPWGVLASLIWLRRYTCSWDGLAEKQAALCDAVRSGEAVASPFTMLAVADEPKLHLTCARNYVQSVVPQDRPAVFPARARRPGPLRLGYVSGDFHRHATAALIATLFERHDRERFEVHGFSIGPEKDDPVRRRLVDAFDGFHVMNNLSDRDAAGLMRERGIDIAIDLKGHTHNSRPGILAYRPAPIQIQYLGFPGTLGCDFIDYAIVDHIVVPTGQERFYTEALVRLPDCYQINDALRPLSEEAPTRAACGLPEDAFVFCCFNNNYKITPEIFDIWMELLASVPGSILWLLGDNDLVESNLRREAELRGVASHRLIFAPRAPQAEHLARQRCADLFLDTLPYNAHTTASDALWVGLPVLTCCGHAFAGRVAASILVTHGLDELVTTSLPAYAATARALAQDRGRLQALRQRIDNMRSLSPIFDIDRFQAHLEDAYLEMWRRWELGEPATSFSVRARP
ncbi:MAG: tetratricopeptide repeat protein [Pseudomonadota bacterium]